MHSHAGAWERGKMSIRGWFCRGEKILVRKMVFNLLKYFDLLDLLRMVNICMDSDIRFAGFK